MVSDVMIEIFATPSRSATQRPTGQETARELLDAGRAPRPRGPERSIPRSARGCSETSAAPIGAASTRETPCSIRRRAAHCAGRCPAAGRRRKTRRGHGRARVSDARDGRPDRLGRRAAGRRWRMLQRTGPERSETYARAAANRGRVQLKLGKLGRGAALLRESRRPVARSAAARATRRSQRCSWSCRACTCGRTILRPPSAARARRSTSSASAAPAASRSRLCAERSLGEVLRLQGRSDEAAPLFEDSLAAQPHAVRRGQRRRSPTCSTRWRGSDERKASLAEAEDYAQQAVRVAAKQPRAGSLGNRLLPHLARRDHARARGNTTRRSSSCAPRSPRFEKTLPPIISTSPPPSTVLGEVLLRTNRADRTPKPCFTAAMNQLEARRSEPEWRVARSESGSGRSVLSPGPGARSRAATRERATER